MGDSAPHDEGQKERNAKNKADGFGSSSGITSTLGYHPLGGGAHVYHGRRADLRHDHCVRDVLPRRVRILNPLIRQNSADGNREE
jgi:hypothetical protein